MQNSTTGMLEKLSEEQYDRLEKLDHGEAMNMTFRDGSIVPANVAKFRVGEFVEVKGGTFMIRKITKKDLILRAVK